MSNDVINHWVERARNSAASHGDADSQPSGVQVIRRVQPSKGEIIMAIAERLMPWLKENLLGKRHEDGLMVQPATVRAVALNVAQNLVKDHENNYF